MAEDQPTIPDPITEPHEHPCCAGCAADKYAGEEWF